MALIELRETIVRYLTGGPQARPPAVDDAAPSPPISVDEPGLSADRIPSTPDTAPDDDPADPLCPAFDSLVLAYSYAQQDGDAATQEAIEIAVIVVGDRIVQRLDAMRAMRG